jgi:predicted Fe-S protein YdhL (DUF1289 family)
MRPDIDAETVRSDHFTPCPGCGSIGHTIQTWVHKDDSEKVIQLMACPEAADDCRVKEYYPEVLGDAE